MKQLMAILLGIIAFQITYSQSYYCRNFGNEVGEFNSVSPAPNGDYYVVGQSFKLKNEDILLMRLDSLGNVVWAKTLANASIDEEGFRVLTFPNGDALTASTLRSPSDNTIVRRWDPSGNVIWEQMVTANNPSLSARVEDMILGANGNIYMVSEDQFWALSPTGTLLVGKEYNWGNGGVLKDLVETASGDLILGGRYTAPTAIRPMLMRVDPQGNPIWQKWYDRGRGIIDMAPTNDGNFVFINQSDGGSTEICDAYKFDSSGTIIWSRVFTDASANMRGKNVLGMSNGDIAISGSYSNGSTPTNIFFLRVSSIGVVTSCERGDLLQNKSGYFPTLLERSNGGLACATGRNLMVLNSNWNFCTSVIAPAGQNFQTATATNSILPTSISNFQVLPVENRPLDLAVSNHSYCDTIPPCYANYEVDIFADISESVCQGRKITFSNSVPSSFQANKQWYLDGNPLGTSTEQAITFSSPGNYTISVTNEVNPGCFKYAEMMITVDACYTGSPGSIETWDYPGNAGQGVDLQEADNKDWMILFRSENNDTAKVMLTDSSANVRWTKWIGLPQGNALHCHLIQPLHNGNYMIIGEYFNGSNKIQYTIIMDGQGNFLSSPAYSFPSSYHAYDVQISPDSFVYVIGTHNSEEVMTKYDQNGTLIWSNDYDISFPNQTFQFTSAEWKELRIRNANELYVAADFGRIIQLDSNGNVVQANLYGNDNGQTATGRATSFEIMPNGDMTYFTSKEFTQNQTYISYFRIGPTGLPLYYRGHRYGTLLSTSTVGTLQGWDNEIIGTSVISTSYSRIYKIDEWGNQMVNYINHGSPRQSGDRRTIRKSYDGGIMVNHGTSWSKLDNSLESCSPSFSFMNPEGGNIFRHTNSTNIVTPQTRIFVSTIIPLLTDQRSKNLICQQCPPFADFSPSSSSACTGNQIFFNPQISGASSYSWYENGVLFSNAYGPSLTFNTPGTYDIKLVTSSPNCSDSSTVTITVNGPVISTGPDQRICAGDSVQISVSGGTSYTWTPSSTLSNANISSPMAFPTTTTNYSVLVDDGQGCTGTGTVRVNVDPLPQVNAGVNQSICQGGSATLTGNANGNAPFSFTWSPGNLNGSTQVISPNLSTSYQLTVIDSAGCEGNNQVMITVNDTPTVSLGPNMQICLGDSLLISGTVSGGNAPFTYLWNNGNTSPSQQVSPTSNTSYSVSVTDVNLCQSQATSTVVVNPLPTAAFSFLNPSGLQIDFTSLSSADATAWNWDFGDGTNSTAPNPIHTYSADGTYIVCLSVSNVNLCEDITCDTLLLQTTGTIGSDPELNIVIFPNPADQLLEIRFAAAPLNSYEVRIADVFGKVVFSQTMEASGNTEAKLNLSNLAQGSYMLELAGSEFHTKKQIVIVR